MKIFLLCFFTVALICIAESAKCDDRNASFKSCGSVCPVTCANYGKMERCTQQCVPGCFCKPPYIESHWGCVRPRDCKRAERGIRVAGQSRCPVLHAEWKDCGTACPPTCDNYMHVQFCGQRCKRGCFCEQPYIASTLGCVLPDECPAIHNQDIKVHE